MKKSKMIKTVLMFVVLCLLLWTKPMQAKTIVYAEYFIDTDPGQGLGTPLLACDGVFDEATECLHLNGISSLLLAEGSHTLYVRIKDSDNVWGTIRQLTFNVIGSNPYKTLKAGEYFIDTDPGVGLGIPLTATDSVFDESTEEAFKDSIGTSSLSIGPHLVYVRFKDNWSNSPTFNGWGTTKIDTLKICTSRYGDANSDGKVTVGDVVYLVSYLFKGGPPPCALSSGDTNGDCTITVGDVVYLVSYLFKFGPTPKAGCVK
jgi:hypothetical protein